jgi:hypothetical protein
MRRLAIFLPLLALGAGTAAIAQDGPPSSTREPDLTSREVFDLPGGCRPGERVTVRIDPSGATLASVRVHVAGLEVLELTGVHGPASATVLIPSREPTRVTATADSLGGQALYLSRVYGRCAPPPQPPALGRPVIGGGED